MKVIATSKAPAAIGPYSQAVKVGDLLFTSGQIPLRPDGTFVDGTIVEQAEQVMNNLQEVLHEAGTKFDKVIKTVIFLADMNDFVAVNEVYGKYFDKHFPARSTVCVKALPKGALVEIEMIAKVGL